MNFHDRSLYSRNHHELPVDGHRSSILYSLEHHRVLIIAGETGSGKSTRVPQILYAAGIFNQSYESKSDRINHSVICVTQPRRVAAIQLAQRVAKDLKCNLGSTVGYAVRFNDVTDPEQTMIKFMTEGLLLREMLIDPLLRRYSVIMVDEVHERNLNTDILLGLLKCLLAKRKDLKLIICSATLDIDNILQFLTYKLSTDLDPGEERPVVLKIEGKTYPIRIFYRQSPVANYLDAAVETAINIHETNRLASGKILIFLTGQDEVENVCERLKDYAQTSSERLDLKKLYVIPLFASLKQDDIAKVFESYGRNTRLCIVATNVAETSLTIEDVAFVVDCGFTKLKTYSHRTGTDTLVRVPVSKSSARQRAGRAGRTRNGNVYRLYTEEEFDKLDDDTVPELQRCSLAGTVMVLKSLGVSNPSRFPLMSPLPKDNLVAALESLYALSAIDQAGKLTRQGELMSILNLDPRVSKFLVSDVSSSCASEVCKIAGLLQIKDLYLKPGKHASSLWTNTNLADVCVSEGDLPSYLNMLNGFLTNNKSRKWAEKRCLNYQAMLNAVDIATRLESQLRRFGVRISSAKGRLETIQRSIVTGLFSNAAYLHPSGAYKTIKGDQVVHIHPTSVFSELIERPKYVVFVEILNTTKTYMRHLMSIEPNWLLEAAPDFFTFGTNIDATRK